MKMTETTKRKANWTQEEITRLTTAYSEKYKLLESKFSSNITATEKKAAWEGVLDS